MKSLSRSSFSSNMDREKSRERDPRIQNSGGSLAKRSREQRGSRKVIVSIYGKDVAEYELQPESKDRENGKQEKAA